MAIAMTLMDKFTHGNEFLIRCLLSRNYKMFIFSVTITDTYSTNGWTVTNGTLKKYLPTEVEYVLVLPYTGYTFDWDLVNSKLICYTTAATQLSNSSASLANAVIQCIAFGR